MTALAVASMFALGVHSARAFYVRTTEPVQVAIATVPAGSYIDIAYYYTDGSRDDVWYNIPITEFPRRRGKLFAIIVAIMALWALLAFLRKQQKDAQDPDLEYRLNPKLVAAIDRRFPPHVVFRLTTEDRKACDFKPEDFKIPGYSEKLDLWQTLLDRYPAPPQNESDRRSREEIFWRGWAEQSTLGTELKPKQEIIDYFRWMEKWILRGYYAATGIVHKSIIEEECRIRRMHMCAKEEDNFYVMNKASDEIYRLINEKAPAHYEKWGEWFYFNVQSAFEKMHAPASPGFGPASPTSPADSDSDLDYKPTV